MSDEPRIEGNILGVTEGNKVITFKCEETQQWVIKNDIDSCTPKDEISTLDIFMLPIIKEY